MSTQTFPRTFENPVILNARGPLTIAAVWVLQIAAAYLFITAGAPKIASDPTMVQVFEAIGAGQWFRYLTGGIEIVAGVLLLVPSLAAYGAAALVVTMIGAVATHLFVIGGSPVAALVLLAVTATIVWLRRESFGVVRAS